MTEPTELNYSSIGWTVARLARQVEVAARDARALAGSVPDARADREGHGCLELSREKLAVSAPSVTSVVEALVQRGAVERAHLAEDRRRIALALTDYGRDLLGSAEEVLQERLQTIADELADEALVSGAMSAMSLWAKRSTVPGRAPHGARWPNRGPSLERPHTAVRYWERPRHLGARRPLLRADRRDVALLAASGGHRPGPVQDLARAGGPVIKTHKGIWSLSLAMSFLALLSQVQIPRIIGEAINECLPTAGHTTDLKRLSSFATLLFVLIGVREVCNYLGRRCLLTTAYSFEYDLRHIMYEHYMSLSFPFSTACSVGQLISRANSDVRAVQQYLVMAPTVLVQCAVIFIAFAEMFTINVQLTLVTAISLPITFLVGVAMRKKIYPVSWLIQARLADIAMLVEENVSGVRVVKSVAAEQKELTTLARAADKLQWSYIKDANIRGTWPPLWKTSHAVGLAVILLYGGVLVVHDHLGVGTLFTFQA